jgi:hypothetical protein
MLERARPLGDDPADRLIELVQECALLEAMLSDGAERLLLSLRPVGGPETTLTTKLAGAYLNLFSRQNGFVATRLEKLDEWCEWMVLEMPGAAAIFHGEQGTHLFYPPHENVLPVQLVATPLAEHEDAATVARDQMTARERWRALVAAGEASPESDAHPLGPVVRIYDPAVATLDLRTGLLCPNLALGEDLRRFILAALPLPARLSTSSP